MEVLNRQEGKLNVTVASTEDGVQHLIRAGSPVVIESVCDNFKNIFVRVISPRDVVKLNYYDTDIKWLLGNS